MEKAPPAGASTDLVLEFLKAECEVRVGCPLGF